MGVVLIGDVLQRLRFAKDFYSNDGVLPNHSHLFNLRETGQIWSLLHAFSSPNEAQTGLFFILIAYVFFLVGWRTRVFQVVAFLCLWSLGSRDILLENAGNYLAMALLGLTLFLPLGSRFSLDSLRASMDLRDEKTARGLNDRPIPSQLALDAARDPGWTPTSIAALAVLAQLAIVYACMALQQKGDAWADGNGLYYALNTERWASPVGAALRGLPGGLLGVWARAFRAAELAVPVLLFVPLPVVAARYARLAAAALIVFTGLTLAIPFSLGLFGWTLAASAALVLAPGTWDAIEGKPRAKRARTVIYDVDCGVCLWLARVLKRLDLRHHLTFRGNDDLEGLPADVTPDLVAQTLVVITAAGAVETRARAVAAILDALPLGWTLGWMVRLPGIVQLKNLAYDAFAARRQRVSVAMGKGACGIDAPHDDADLPVAPTVAAPAVRLARGVTGGARELAALVLFAAIVSQATQVNEIGWKKLVQPHWLEAVVGWPRMLERWDVLARQKTNGDFRREGLGVRIDLGVDGVSVHIDAGATVLR